MVKDIDRLEKAVTQATKILLEERPDVLLVAAIKGGTVYRMSNIDSDEELKKLVEYVFGLEKATDPVEYKAYAAKDGELTLVASSDQEPN